jgi:CRISPR-associated protein Csh1
LSGKGGINMGFLEAVYSLGKRESSTDFSPEWEDIDNFLTLPLPIIEDQDRKGRIIRVWLEAEEPLGKQLEVRDIAKIDVVDFLAGEGTLQEKRRKYLYRDPVGANVTWSYSPTYKLGSPKKADREKLLEETEWKDKQDSRFYKLYNRVLADLEREGVFSKGSVDLIMTKLVERRGEICDLWSDPKRSYILMFGCEDKSVFLYPGDIPAFISYFRQKLAKKSGGGDLIKCSFCGCSEESSASFSDVFKFSTFDKVSFLPGNNKKHKNKVFPICQQCNAMFTKGKDVLRNKFSNGSIINGINIDVVPELIFGHEQLAAVADNVSDFIKKGLRIEKNLFSFLARQGEGLVFHFMFWEKNQAQERVHLIVEDVPPTRLKRLEELWRKSLEVYSPFKKDNTESKYLDFAIRNIVWVYLDLAGTGDSEKKFQMDRCFKVLGQLLNGQKVDVRGLKTNMVSRFPGLFASGDWSQVGPTKSGRMLLVLDFLERVNKAGR